MTQVPAAISRAIAQLTDPKIVKLLFKTILITLAIFLMLGAGLWYGLYKALVNQDVTLSAEIGGLIAILLTILGGWVLFRIIAIAVLQFSPMKLCVQWKNSITGQAWVKHERSVGVKSLAIPCSR